MTTISPQIRRTYTPVGLEAFLHPESVALVGASDAAGKVGQIVMQNLLASPFAGVIYPVNATRDTISGHKAYKSLAELPSTPELAVIVTPARTVPAIIAECSELGVPAALIISAGFRETGSEGIKLEQQILTLARQSGMRIIGPNCLGVMSPCSHLNATFAAGMALQGNVAFLSQSGALCTAVLDWSLEEHVGFSALISLGSMLDVSWGDVIRHFGDDPSTKCIVIYMETVGDPRAFLSAAREASLKKPIVLIKAGRSEVAAKATMSHTGSLAGSDAVLDAAFRRCGILRVKTIADMFYMAEVLGKQPHPNGPRLTIVTNAGGPGVLATDALIEYEGTLADLSADTLNELNRLLPEHWSHGNPVDVLGDASPERYAQAMEIALRDPETDGLLAIVTPQGMTSSTEIARSMVSLGNAGKPVLASFMGGTGMRDAIAVLNANGIPSFPYPDSAARIFEYMWQYSRNLQTLYETPLIDEEDSGPAPDVVGTTLRRASDTGRTVLTEAESKIILHAYGIPVVETIVALEEDLAVAAAARLGFPVVLKLNSETITHKTDVGGVVLNLASLD
ncbi:MAG: CoA-binding protein, partial [Bryobacteraceae bacterium]|nr:CoA-binding protein [Bryobacteraceae bacterium]